ncbi:MAG: hypothetical protein HYR85_02930 [Planctomycetes bacterium]|nr:hypothetical protein [Planctomycetota bacterium]MBI3844426.1 hypothetical protein [Planctomycetota bacterium]
MACDRGDGQKKTSTHAWRVRGLVASSALLLAAACTWNTDPAARESWGLSPADQACATCHEPQASELTAARRPHDRAIGCTSCHAPHEALPHDERGPSKLVANCESCHAEAVAEFRQPFRHPLNAQVACTSCHPPHGGSPSELREQVRRESCVGCHSDKRGPFVFDHEADRLRRCGSCHEPHGSPNRRLLTYAEPRLMCFSCHDNLEATHVQIPGGTFTKCLSCHTEIHGSNFDSKLLR